MPFNVMTLSRVDMPISQAEGLKILERYWKIFRSARSTG